MSLLGCMNEKFEGETIQSQDADAKFILTSTTFNGGSELSEKVHHIFKSNAGRAISGLFLQVNLVICQS